MYTTARYNVNGHHSQCTDCEGWQDPTEVPMFKDYDGSEYCANCAEMKGYIICTNCAEYVLESASITHDGEPYCGDCFDNLDLFECVACGEYHNEADRHDYEGDEYCESCFDDLDLFECVDCNKYYSKDECREWKNDLYCDGCFDDLGLAFCESCDEYFEADEIAECSERTYSHRVGGRSSMTTHYYCEDCASNNGWEKCYDCGEWTRDHHSSDPNGFGDYYCSDCFYEHYNYCGQCGEVVHNDEAVYTDGDTYCDECAPRNGDDFDPRRRSMNISDNYDKVGSPRKFGVELETDDCDDYEDLDGGWFGAKDDPTVGGKEFFSAILNGNNGMDAVDELTDFADNNRWSCCSSCGYHLHLDMSNESVEGLQGIALAYQLTYNVWTEFIKRGRINSSYCSGTYDGIDWIKGLGTCDAWRRRSYARGRYYWVNWAAYKRHNTLEVRMHEGTVDGRKVRNWIRAHTIFADWASNAGYDGVLDAFSGCTTQELYAKMSKIWEDAGCSDLAGFYSRAALRETETCTV